MVTRTETPGTPDPFRTSVLKALGHPARLRMLDELRGGERCVCELRDLVSLDLSTVSKHLSLLRAAGLVADERRGAQVFYRLCAPEVTGLLDALEASLDRLARRHAESLAESCGCQLAGVGGLRRTASGGASVRRARADAGSNPVLRKGEVNHALLDL